MLCSSWSSATRCHCHWCDSHCVPLNRRAIGAKADRSSLWRRLALQSPTTRRCVAFSNIVARVSFALAREDMRCILLPMQSDFPAADPAVIVVMGVSGCGKSTIASMLAHRLHWIYEDGDWFHPQSNVEKMHAGEPLTDEDRWPWLEGIAAWIDATRRAGNQGTIACSALKRSYRDILVG